MTMAAKDSIFALVPEASKEGFLKVIEPVLGKGGSMAGLLTSLGEKLQEERKRIEKKGPMESGLFEMEVKLVEKV